ncbi:epoxyqueuosine reductase [Clostridium sp. OS1-26]|uniref:epoxyqueuosine reductase n=1 Tax=Clostridium sp. OS1-26 TaxID=3070681 RepID=UPI0027DF0501|nr:epoxyqueuosine reductase [Clostridium sp. OS1-26]WML32659.1 epoxyqueuosine reductase [Clostridium sp. OS1-26]
MINSNKIKNLLYDLGADLCGIAPIERFKNAPDGFHPKDIFSECKSVVVFAKRAPSASMLSGNRVVYTHVTTSILKELDRICVNACCCLDKLNVGAVMIPADNLYEYWDNEKKQGKGILSLTHAGELAGIGVMGKNTLLVNKDLGNMMYLGALLIDKVVDYDPMITEKYCYDKCKICIENCPKKALNSITVDQALCRSHVAVQSAKGDWLYNCSKCRTLCPNVLGHKKYNFIS